MKKFTAIILLAMLSLLLINGCKKSDKPAMTAAPGDIIKYAKSAAAAYKDQDLKTFGTTLSKTEPVKLVEKLTIQVKGKPVEVAKIKLTDNTVLYIQEKNLADKPVVFIEDTKAYVRNNASSSVYAIIPKGTIGFVLQENADWVQVYVGQIDGKWITQQWVNGGFTAEELRVQEGKLFEESSTAFKNPSTKPEQKKQAEANLKNLTSSTGIFAEMAKKTLGLSDNSGNSGTNMEGAGGNMTDGGAIGSATVRTAAGLTMRENPGTSSRSVAVIPDGTVIKLLQKDSKEETIAGKTSVWCKVEWNGQRGWVFGGFLEF